MSVEDSIYQALAPIVGERVYRDVARTPAAGWPFMVFQQVGGLPANFLESVLPSKRNGRFQVWTWGKDRDSVSGAAREAERLLIESTTLRARTESGLVGIYDEPTGLFGARQDFSIWF